MKALVATILFAASATAAFAAGETSSQAEELKAAFGEAYYLTNVPAKAQQKCGAYVWVARGAMAIDGQAAVYDSASGVLIARCGGMPVPRPVHNWDKDSRCPALLQEAERCFPAP